MKLIIVLLALLSFSFSFAEKTGEVSVSGILSFKSGKALLHLNPLSRSAMVIEIQNISALEKMVGHPQFLGAADVKIDISMYKNSRRAIGLVREFKISHYKKLPNYNDHLIEVKK